MHDSTRDNLKEQLKRLDAESTPDSLHAADLARIVVAKRRQRQRFRRCSQFSAMATAIVIGLLVTAKPIQRVLDIKLDDNVGREIARSEPVGSEKDDVMQLQRELQALRNQSLEMRLIAEQLDAIEEQSKAIDQYLQGLELRRLESQAQVEASESLAINVPYDFGY